MTENREIMAIAMSECSNPNPYPQPVAESAFAVFWRVFCGVLRRSGKDGCSVCDKLMTDVGRTKLTTFATIDGPILAENSAKFRDGRKDRRKQSHSGYRRSTASRG